MTETELELRSSYEKFKNMGMLYVPKPIRRMGRRQTFLA